MSENDVKSPAETTTGQDQQAESAGAQKQEYTYTQPGYTQVGSDATPNAAPVPNYTYAQQPYSSPQPQGQSRQTKVRTAGFGSEKKERWVAAALAFFLGWLGIHKFYLGYKTEGIIMLVVGVAGLLCTLGIGTSVMSIIGIIEAVMYVILSDAEFERTHIREYKGWF